MRPAILFLLILVTGCAPRSSPPTSEPAAAAIAEDGSYVVMVSFDGMRHDMLDGVATPAFDTVAASGVRAEGLIPSYPSKTFPNHYTLATGLYPSNHGIVDNSFFDPDLDAVYRLGDTATVRDGRWYRGEPIWVTAERQGVPAASFFWVGSEAEIEGVRPSFFKYYDETIPFTARVDTVLHWLSLPPAQRPRLMMLYFSEPDHAAHVNGPDAAAVDSVVRELDGVLDRLVTGLRELPIADRTHLLLMSDHGMGPAPDDQVVYLEDYADLDGVRVINNATQAMLYFDGDENRLWSVYEALHDRLEHARIYLKEETPERWHYDHGDRIGDLVIAAEPGWVLRSRDWRPWGGGGTHGWDPAYPAMRGIFMAAGPAIPAGQTVPAFRNIHVYPLVAHLLGLDPAPGIDGRLDVLAPVLKETAPR